jgi:hypothetical protein
MTKINTAGNGFEVLEAIDGFRKDNSLWFGKCSVCEESVTNSRHDNIWMHTVYSEKGWYTPEAFLNGNSPNVSGSKKVDYCPTLENKIEIPDIWVEGGNQ